MARAPMTLAGADRLREELRQMKTVDRPAVDRPVVDRTEWTRPRGAWPRGVRPGGEGGPTAPIRTTIQGNRSGVDRSGGEGEPGANLRWIDASQERVPPERGTPDTAPRREGLPVKRAPGERGAR